MDRLKLIKQRNRTALPPLPPTIPTTFHSFSRLPVELRFQIYSYLIPGPRTIAIKVDELQVTHHSAYQRAMIKIARRNRNRIANFGAGSLSITRGVAMIPALLHVSHEARAYMRRYYQLSFSPFLGYPIWFDFEKDILFLKDTDVMWSFFYGEDIPVQDMVFLRAELKHLMIGGARHRACCTCQIKSMTGLETFTVEKPTNSWIIRNQLPAVQFWEQSIISYLQALWSDAGLQLEDQPEISFMKWKNMKKMAREDRKEMKRRKLIRKGLDPEGQLIKLAMALRI